MTAVRCPAVLSVLISYTSNPPFPRVAGGIVSAVACLWNAQACGDNITLLRCAQWKRGSGSLRRVCAVKTSSNPRFCQYCRNKLN